MIVQLEQAVRAKVAADIQQRKADEQQREAREAARRERLQRELTEKSRADPQDGESSVRKKKKKKKGNASGAGALSFDNEDDEA